MIGALLLLVVAVITTDTTLTYRSIDRVAVAFPEVDDGITTWLLVGTDSRAATTRMPNRDGFGSTQDVPEERADVIIIVQQRTDSTAPQVVSVPRDLIVMRAGKGPDRLALTLLDSPTGLITSVCGSLGVAIDHLVMVRFDGVSQLVDTVGGIPVSVPRPTRDLRTGLDLAAGTSTLDGPQTIAWVRARQLEELTADNQWEPNDAADLGRQTHQRQVLGELSTQLADQVRNPLRARSLAQSLADTLTLDNQTGLVDLTRLIRVLRQPTQDRSLPHRFKPGPIPVAELSQRAQPLLDSLRGTPPDSTCPRARPQPDP